MTPKLFKQPFITCSSSSLSARQSLSKRAQAIQTGHQEECDNTNLLCALEEEAGCCSQANHFLQQLHIWQVVSCSKHCAEHFASCSIPCQLWTSNLTRDFSRAACILCNAPIDIHLQQHNQDLVGFFTSLPIGQIMESVKQLVTQYAAKQNADVSEISFIVQLAATGPKLQVFQGQIKRHKIRTGVSWLKDLCQLCELSLHTSVFFHGTRVFKQQRGSAIGNKTSPSLANIAVSYLEHQWFQKHKDALTNYAEELHIVRYVDNRLVLCGQHLADTWFMQEFLADFFYRHPVELD